MDDTFDLKIRDLLQTKRGRWRAVADASGVSYSWVCKFASGSIENPGYATLKRLHAALNQPVPAHAFHDEDPPP